MSSRLQRIGAQLFGIQMSNSQHRTLKKKLIIYAGSAVILCVVSVYMYVVFFRDFFFRLTWNDYYYWWKGEAWSLTLTVLFVGFTLSTILTAIPIMLMQPLMLISRACGNFLHTRLFSRKRKRIIFFGISMTSLPEVIENLLRKIPSEEQINDWKRRSGSYIVPIQAELQRRLKSQLEVLSSGSSVERFGISQDSKKQESYGVMVCKWIKRVYCFCYPWGASYSSLLTDHDIMFIPCNMAVSFQPGKATFYAMTSEERFPYGTNIPLGFAHVVLNNHLVWDQVRELCISSAGKMYVSNRLVKDIMFSVIDNVPEDVFPSECADSVIDCNHPPAIDVDIRGPSVGCKIYPLYQVCVVSENQEIVRFEGDFIFSLRCVDWPRCAKDWATRPRSWPDCLVIQTVVSRGCLLVPRPSDDHPNCELEWRVSFSEAEVTLSGYIPDSARRFLLALKIIHKDHLKFVCPELKTYYLKTLFYWEMERHSLSYWDGNNCEVILVALLRKLQNCVCEKYLPHYWIEGVNLFTEFDGRACEDLNALLTKVMDKPQPYVFDIASLWC